LLLPLSLRERGWGEGRSCHLPAKAGIQGLNGIACGDACTAMMPLAARRRVTFSCLPKRK
jgi:hypothetical protein